MKKSIDWALLIACLAIVYGVALLGSMFSVPSVDSSWYQSIKPEITPPNWVFPIVWNILFFLISISLYLSWGSSNKKEKKKLILVFGINLALNFLWSFLYFGLQNPLFSFYEIIPLWISIFFMISTTYKVNKTSSLLLIPYLLWVAFAMILNYMSVF